MEERIILDLVAEVTQPRVTAGQTNILTLSQGAYQKETYSNRGLQPNPYNPTINIMVANQKLGMEMPPRDTILKT
jgi:hypothetical protein